MAKINIKNITIDTVDIEHREAYEKAVQHAFETVSTEADFINLIKVKVADMPAENMRQLLQQLSEQLYKQTGVNNCVLVPLHPRGIQDISIEKIEVVHED